MYDYDYALIVGQLEAIRAYAVAHRLEDSRPDDRFSADRWHWIYVNCGDSGFPPAGALRVKLGAEDPYLIGPERWWQATDVPRLYIRAAYRTRQIRAELWWRVPGEQSFSPRRRVEFPIDPDGHFHTYEVDLAASPEYRGAIAGLRFDPVGRGEEGDEVQIAFISWKPE